MRKRIIINALRTEGGEISRTITAHYIKLGVRHLKTEIFGDMGIYEYEEDDKKNRSSECISL